MVQEHVMAGKENLKNTAIYSVSYVREKLNRSARWQHIARYSHCILFTRVIYVWRYISEQKATFGRRERARGRGGAGHPHAGLSRTHARPLCPCVAGPADRATRRILIIMKGETLFVGQELNL